MVSTPPLATPSLRLAATSRPERPVVTTREALYLLKASPGVVSVYIVFVKLAVNDA
jgi:hypothetical protein